MLIIDFSYSYLDTERDYLNYTRSAMPSLHPIIIFLLYTSILLLQSGLKLASPIPIA